MGQNFGDIIIIAGILVLAAPLIWSLKASYTQEHEQIEWNLPPTQKQDDESTWPPTTIIIKRINLSAVVVEGRSDKDLDRGPMHIAGTAWPGENGNCCIAAHKEKWFRKLRELRVGDPVVLKTHQGEHTYRVVSQKTVSPKDVNVMDQTADPTLTLITCTGIPYGGSKHRLIVVGKMEK